MTRTATLAFVAAAWALLAGGPTLAVETPAAGAIDPRIRTLAYDPDQVFQLKGYFGYQLMIEFAANERIENVSIGDSLGWQVTPNKKANLLFLKPIDRTAATNMTVVTDHRRYAFELAVAGEKPKLDEMAYIVRFRYPQDGPAQIVDLGPPPAPPAPPPEAWNFSYSFSGSKEAAPSRVFDDGRSTYFAWNEGALSPAVFVVGPDGDERLANYAVKGRYVVVDQVAARFVLRNGKSVATVVNDAVPHAGKGVGPLTAIDNHSGPPP